MAYYGNYRKRSYRSWRSRGYVSSSSWSSKSTELFRTFGSAIYEIRTAFLNLTDDALDELLKDYGAIYGSSAERYARKTYTLWKSGKTNLSGQTLERLVEFVPPYLEPEQKIHLVRMIAVKHEQKPAHYKTVSINLKEPGNAYLEIDTLLHQMDTEDVLAHLPEHVMKAATWLYDDDVTAARAILAESKRTQNEIMKTSARREIDLLKRTISSGQIKSANYRIELPSGILQIQAYSPKKGLLSTIIEWLI